MTAVATTKDLTVPTSLRRPKERVNLTSSAIQTICEQFRASRDEERASMVLRREVRKRVNAQMPPPHPSIVHSAETAADGIDEERWPDECPHGAIRPWLIKEALDKIKPLTVTITESPPSVRIVTYLDEPLPLSEADAAKRDRLQARLELSQVYFAEQKRRLEEVGVIDRADAESYAEADKLAKLERKLIKLKARTADDLLAKIELFNSDPNFFEPADDEGLVGSILEDTAAFLKASRGH